MPEIGCKEVMAVSTAGRPDNRLDFFERYFLVENELRGDRVVSPGTVLGLCSGNRLSGSAINSAGLYRDQR